MTETEQKQFIPYFFAFRFNVAGLVDSDLSAEQLREELTQNLTAIYGEGGFDVLEVRPATPDEVAGITAALNEDKTLN